MEKHTRRVKTRHIILAVMCLMYFISYIDRVNIAVAGPLIRQEMGLTSAQLGLVFSAFAYPYAVMQIIGGWLADKYGPKIVLTVLSIIWGVATLATGFAGSVTMLVAMAPLVVLFELSVQLARFFERRAEKRAEDEWDPDDDPAVS